MQKITPWEVEGDIDYSKLVKEFGTSPISDPLLKRIKKHTKDLHFMLTRKIFFSHRDFNWLLDEYEKNNKFFLYTGRAPSGDIHLGHLVPWIFTKWLQDKFNVELLFQFPDEEKVVFKKDLTFEDTEKFTKENMLDIIALGFNPKKTKFIIDTKHANLMYKPAMQVAKKITFSTVKATFGLNNQSNLGQIFYTSMQAVPAFLPSILKKKNIPCLIPLAIDQDAHFRVSRDVIPKLGYYKPAIIHSMFLPSLLGPKGKMSSSSEQDTIYTTDSPSTVESKIKKYAFSGGKPTLEEHRKKGGNPDIDVSFQYLRMLFEPDDKKLSKIYNDYKSGSLLTSELKEILIKKVNTFLKKHQQKRELAKKQVNKFIL
ncbi:tryptophan--tRNA ligase [archaeon]|nr:tryptophan--tRNA ligase [archaeon]|tara:strand:+ start:2117 stop:3226 length:1110 start_codon:yes stop_codon:yes gene_type:complete